MELEYKGYIVSIEPDNETPPPHTFLMYRILWAPDRDERARSTEYTNAAEAIRSAQEEIDANFYNNYPTR